MVPKREKDYQGSGTWKLALQRENAGNEKEHRSARCSCWLLFHHSVASFKEQQQHLLCGNILLLHGHHFTRSPHRITMSFDKPDRSQKLHSVTDRNMGTVSSISAFSSPPQILGLLFWLISGSQEASGAQSSQLSTQIRVRCGPFMDIPMKQIKILTGFQPSCGFSTSAFPQGIGPRSHAIQGHSPGQHYLDRFRFELQKTVKCAWLRGCSILRKVATLDS